MLDLYSRELEYSINFIQPEDINLKKEFKKMNYYLEDYFEELNLESILNF